MVESVKSAITHQFEAALAMMNDCLVKCPEADWDGIIGKYPFWHVTYHTLMFVDYYLEPQHESFQPREDFHPAGWKEYDDEYPSRRFSKQEMLEYVQICLQKLRDVMAGETQDTLLAPCGLPRRNFSRAELYMYNMRHVMHHTGQLSAFLRRRDVHPSWVSAGWK